MWGMPTDEELMARYVAGDRAALREIFDRYAPLLLQMMQHRLGRREDAHDLVQQTFLQLHRSRADFRPNSLLRPWLFTIAINLKRRYFRILERRRELPLPADELAAASTDSMQIDKNDVEQRVRSALAALPPYQREVIELHWFGGLTFGEIAVAVGASLSAVKVRAHRGYTSLRNRFADELRHHRAHRAAKDDDGLS